MCQADGGDTPFLALCWGFNVEQQHIEGGLPVHLNQTTD